MAEVIRLDKWLWAARFFKTRRLAAKAVSGGKVHLAGHRIKPGRSVIVGDALSIRRGDFSYEISVLAINPQRRSASEASLLYAETEASKEARNNQAELRRIAGDMRPRPERKPNKHERGRIMRFKRKPE